MFLQRRFARNAAAVSVSQEALAGRGRAALVSPPDGPFSASFAFDPRRSAAQKGITFYPND